MKSPSEYCWIYYSYVRNMYNGMSYDIYILVILYDKGNLKQIIKCQFFSDMNS